MEYENREIIECFLVKIFRGHDELARLVFRIGPRADLGRVEYPGSDDPELDAIMESSIMQRRWWHWPALSTALTDNLTMATGGRYIPRFHQTPVPDGRGVEERLRKCFQMRVIA